MTTHSYHYLYCSHSSAYVSVLWYGTQMSHVGLSVVPTLNNELSVGKVAISKTYARIHPQRTFTRASTNQDDIVVIVRVVWDKSSKNWWNQLQLYKLHYSWNTYKASLNQILHCSENCKLNSNWKLTFGWVVVGGGGGGWWWWWWGGGGGGGG